MQRKKIGLALGGGGARGFCHIGVLRALEENGIPVDCVAGCSMGAIVGGCYCAGVPVETLYGLARKITKRVLLDINISKKKYGVMRGKRAEKTIRSLVGDRTFESCGIPFCATATDVRSGTLKVLQSGKLIDAIRASMSIPAAFHAVTTENEILVDGGVIERIPIESCKAMGADTVIAVDPLGAPSSDFVPDGVLSIMDRSCWIMDWQITRENLKKADFVISPDLGNISTYSFKDNEFSVRQGYTAAQEVIPQIKSWLEAENAESQV